MERLLFFLFRASPRDFSFRFRFISLTTNDESVRRTRRNVHTVPRLLVTTATDTKLTSNNQSGVVYRARRWENIYPRLVSVLRPRNTRL